MWTLAFLLCASLLIFFLHSLVHKYHTWPVTTEFKENHKTSIDFPDVTICSLNQIMNIYHENKIIEEYFEDCEGIQFNHTDGETGFCDITHTDGGTMFCDITAFIRNFAKQNVLREDCPPFVVECQLIGTNWQNIQNCTNDFVRDWNQNYYSCYTIRVSKLKRPNKQIIRGMILILNNGPPNKEQTSLVNSLTLLENEVRLAIHSPGTLPDLKRGVGLSPGTNNKIKVTQTNIQRLDKPYNPIGCTRQEYLPNSTSEKYDQDQCIEYHFQLQIYQNCGCVADWFSIPKPLRDISSCGNTSFSIDPQIVSDEWNKILCACNVTFDDYLDYCKPPCFEKKYDLTVVSSRWPPKSAELSIYQKYFKECINNFPKVKERFSAYECINNLKKNSTNAFCSNYSLSDLKEIDESLLSINLIIEEDFPYTNLEKPLYTWDVMVGVVGGVLSLWLGISAMTIPEILELVYFILRRFSKLISSKSFSFSK